MGDPSGLIRLIRPVNCFMIGFAILIGALIGGVNILNSPGELFLAFLTGFTLAGSAMAINDYYDREIDAINEPQRPIPSGAVTPAEALTVFIFLSVIGLVSSWIIGLGHTVIAAITWVALITYSTVGKRTGLPGNFIVSTCIAFPFVYGGIMNFDSNLDLIFLFAFIAFLTNMGREVTKGIVDVDGDAAMGIRTVAVSRGAVTAAWVSVFFYVFAVVVSFIPPFLEMVSLWYVPFVAFTDLGLIYLSLSLVREPSGENSRKVKTHVFILMLSGLLGFIAGSLL